MTVPINTVAKKTQPDSAKACVPESRTPTVQPSAIIEELYLATVSRFPTAQEQELMQRSLTETDDRRKAVEDILWTLLNTREFVFNR